MSAKSLENNTLAALANRAPRHVTKAIETAAQRTGVNFAYLMQQASAESSFNPAAKAKTSSAAGLYQFIESTWLNMVERYGDKHGIATEGKSRKELLNMRYEPETASVMAAEFANENKQFLDLHWGGEVGSTELYFAHFLGAGGAASFLKSRDQNGLQPAAHLFPKAAKANYNVFYDANTGRPKTLDEIYAFFDQKFGIHEPAPTPSIKPVLDQDQTGATEDALIASSTLAPVRSQVFKTTRGSAGLYALAMQAQADPAKSGFRNILSNPLDLIMLTQLEVPGAIENTENKTFGRKATIL